MMVRDEHVTHTGSWSFATEASTIGLPPGEWPMYLNTSGEMLGRRVLRHFSASRDAHLYTESNGPMRLVVLND